MTTRDPESATVAEPVTASTPARGSNALMTPTSGRPLLASVIRLGVGLLPIALHTAATSAALAAVTRFGWLAAAPIYVLILPICAGLVACLGRRQIVPGRFARDPVTALYRGRLVYGAAWTTLFYCRPIYHAVLLLPPLRWMTFRLFGYMGHRDFTVYPDSWIRDLPLLEFGRGAMSPIARRSEPTWC